MIKILNFAAVFMALSLGAANAADVVPESTYSWTGFYSGIHVEYTSVDGNYFADTVGDFDIGAEGVKFGTLGGYNYQSGNLVFGLESDSGFGSIKDSNAVIESYKIGLEGTARSRMGFAFNRVLPFVTAGVALAEAKSTDQGVGADSQYHLGLVLGGGLEFAATDHIRLRGEYLFESFGKETYNIGIFNDTAKWDQHVARAAVIWAW